MALAAAQLHVCSFVRLAPGLEVDAETAQKNIEKLKWKHHMRAPPPFRSQRVPKCSCGGWELTWRHGGLLIVDNLLYAYASLLIAKLRGEDALLTFKDICEKYQIMLTEEEKIQLELAGHRHYSIEGLLTMLWVRVRHVSKARDSTRDYAAGVCRCVPDISLCAQTNMVVKGDVAVPAPFSSQTFRVSFETSDNVIRALQIVSTPYPYPLAQVCCVCRPRR